MYKASRELEAAILDMAPPYTIQGTPANSWAQLKLWHASTGWQYSTNPNQDEYEAMPVHVAGTDREHSIFSRQHIHLAFRAWHDYLHLVHGQPFDNPGEWFVANQHIAELQLYDVTARDLRAMEYFTWGEVKHYNLYRNYVHYKREFVTECLNRGLQSTLALGSWTLV